MPKTTAIVPVEQIESRILLIRGHKVILDSDLAELYDVPTKRLNEQVKRNHDRFLFQLTPEETVNLRSQIATSKQRRGGRRYRPYAFTEHGAIMAASVLNTHRAIEVSVYVVRAFVKLREMLRTHKELAQKLSRKPRELEIDVCKQSGLPSRNIEGLNKNEGSLRLPYICENFLPIRNFMATFPLTDRSKPLRTLDSLGSVASVGF